MLQTMGIMMMSLVVGKVIITLIIDGLFQGKLSNLIIGILMKMNLSQAEADVIYQNVFRANRDVFQWIGFMLLFLVGYYAALSKTANYLKNIGDGIDNVLSNSKQPIELETELEPIAEKLNTMKMTLARKERMAQESEQRKNDLVVYLAHDLKTPLTSVIAYLSMLDEKPDMPPEERKKYIHIAHTKAIRLSELISEFFEITKFNLQNIRLEKETINLSLMLEQIMDEFYAVFADNNLTGNIYTEEDLMVEGDPENVDAQYRTEYSVKALTDAGLEVECLSDQVGNWQQDQAQQIVANALGQYGDKVEVVFCNNDAMALGALQAIQSAGRTVGTDIFLVGVDALSEALEDVVAGTMTGTVFNDHFSQSHGAADAAINFINGETNEYYIGCDYVKVTKDNAQEILDMVK